MGENIVAHGRLMPHPKFLEAIVKSLIFIISASPQIYRRALPPNIYSVHPQFLCLLLHMNILKIWRLGLNKELKWNEILERTNEF